MRLIPPEDILWSLLESLKNIYTFSIDLYTSCFINCLVNVLLLQHLTTLEWTNPRGLVWSLLSPKALPGPSVGNWVLINREDKHKLSPSSSFDTTKESRCSKTIKTHFLFIFREKYSSCWSVSTHFSITCCHFITLPLVWFKTHSWGTLAGSGRY